MTRRHDVDALRSAAFALLILYHVGMYYVAGWPWHLKSGYSAEWLQIPMRFVNIWRMDLIFLISGVALGFLRRGSSPLGLLAQRSLRLLLPLAFGMAAVIPLQPYLQGVGNGLVEPGFGHFLLAYYSGGPWPRGAFDGWEHGVTWNHLWYLAYLWTYTVILVLMLPALDSRAGCWLRERFAGLRGAALIVLPALPFLAWSALLQPRFPPTHDLIHDWYLHAVYFTAFLYGHWIGTDERLWREATRLRHAALAVALASFAVYLFFAAPATRGIAIAFRNLYLWSAIVAALGYAHSHLNRPFAWLPWATESVYPWYVLHQTLILVLAAAIAPLALDPVLEPILIAGGTVLGCLAITELLVRPWRWVRPLFGLKPLQAVREWPRLGTRCLRS
ncbi:MAG TPA: acyltransferase [Burkholderiales bacterium]